jgi:hypothetical protein
MYFVNFKKCILNNLKYVYQILKCMIKKPKFMCVIVGYTDVIVKDPETGIYIVPITALKP